MTGPGNQDQPLCYLNRSAQTASPCRNYTNAARFKTQLMMLRIKQAEEKFDNVNPLAYFPVHVHTMFAAWIKPGTMPVSLKLEPPPYEKQQLSKERYKSKTSILDLQDL